MTLNGVPASPDLLAPGYAVYRERVPATAWDVTDGIRAGSRNTMRVTLGTGIAWVSPTTRYSKLVAEHLPPRVLLRLALTSNSGTHHVVSSGDWSSMLTATESAHWFAGEDHDAEQPDHDVRPAAVLGAPDLHHVWWAEQPGLRITETLPPVAVTRVDDGARLYDFGVNVAGRPASRLDGGCRPRVAALARRDARRRRRIDQKSTGTPIYDTYRTRSGDQNWAPAHVYHGFRYIELHGLPDDAPDPVITAEVIRADERPSGTFSTDDPFLNTLDTVIDRAIQGNMFSVFTDCPNREKLGWIEQLYLCFDVLDRHYDVERAPARRPRAHDRLAAADRQRAEHRARDGRFLRSPVGRRPERIPRRPQLGRGARHLPWLLYVNGGRPPPGAGDLAGHPALPRRSSPPANRRACSTSAWATGSHSTRAPRAR